MADVSVKNTFNELSGSNLVPTKPGFFVQEVKAPNPNKTTQKADPKMAALLRGRQWLIVFNNLIIKLVKRFEIILISLIIK